MRANTVATVVVVRDAVEELRGPSLITGEADLDYLLADMLAILAALHDETGIDLEGLPQARYVAEWVLEDRS